MTTANMLLDTGALISLLDRSQREHERFVACFEAWSGAVVTTEAVLTEATHLLSRVPGGAVACLDFVLAGGAAVVPASQGSLARCRELIARYADLPMDFADATLVVLAEEIGSYSVCTTDRRDFTVYRAAGRQRFRIVPE
ncbi:MAG: PIN domain-containing protein [Proteobacteria bacterium]|nr:PIN domain-containing protein [Pseudomonadota bacterium]